MIFDAIIISDIHLGSSLCHADDLLDFLHDIRHSKIETELIILNGDVFDSHDFRRLKKSHWRILSNIRKLSGYVRVVWVVGNHDGPVDILSHLLGIEAVEEFHLSSGTKNILITHGDKFDEIMSKHPFISHWADIFYRWSTRILPKCICRLMKRSSKTYSRAINIVKERAVSEAHKRKYDGVICGHVHKPEICYENNITYANSGSWTEQPCTLVTVKDGEICLNNYTKGEYIPMS